MIVDEMGNKPTGETMTKQLTCSEIREAHASGHRKTYEHPFDFFEARESEGLQIHAVYYDPTPIEGVHYLIFSTSGTAKPPYQQYRVARFKARGSKIDVLTSKNKKVAVKFVKRDGPPSYEEISEHFNGDLHRWRTGKKIYG